MALVLNPPTPDAYESKSLAQMIARVMAGCGFVDPLTVTRTASIVRSNGVVITLNESPTMKDIRERIINRLGLAVALLASTDTFTNIYNDVYQATGYAGLSSAPPGVSEMIGVLINEAQKMLFTRIELDKGGVTAPTTFSGSQQSSIDASLLRAASIALVKAHFGKADAGAYGSQVEQYLKDVGQRTPPNIVGQVNTAIIAANDTITRRYETGYSGTVNSTFGGAVRLSGNYASTASDNDITEVDGALVEMLALASLKAKVGQGDAKLLAEQFEQLMADAERRCPGNARTVVRQCVQNAQDELYHSYSVFRMERWYSWTTVADQVFYGTFGDDNANSIAPTNGLAVAGAAVTSHNMITGRGYAAHATLRDGRVIYAGGWDATGGFPTKVEAFDPATGKFSALNPMSVGRYAPAFTLLRDGRLFVAGGYGFLSSTEIYNPATGAWSPGPNLSVGRYAATATLMLDGRVLIVGGDKADVNVTTDVVEIYDPSTNLMSTTGSLSVGRSYHTATMLNDGKVLVAGGYASGITSTLVAELYNPATGTFSAVSGGMLHYRFDHTATLLTNGNVLLAGGTGPGGLATTEIFDINSRTFVAGADMPTSRFKHQAVLLDTGEVLLAGGFAVTFNTSTAIRAVDGTWSVGPVAPGVFGDWTQADLLQDGRVLIAGGSTNNLASNIQNKAALYDPDLGSISYTGSLTAGSNFYVITAVTANGSSLPGVEFFVTGVTSDTAVDISWVPVPNQPFVLYFDIYRGKTTGAEGFIARVPRSLQTYTDDGTIPQGAAPPTINATAGPGALDPRRVTWVGAGQNEVSLRPLICGIPPEYLNGTQTGPPQYYEIRQALEIRPIPTGDNWKVYIKGFFPPFVLEEDNDQTSIDWKAVQLQAVADVKAAYPKRFSIEEQRKAQAKVVAYVGSLVAGSHMTAKYIPGRGNRQPPAVRPMLKP